MLRKFEQGIYRDKLVTSTIRAGNLFTISFSVLIIWYLLLFYAKLLVHHMGNVNVFALSPFVPSRLKRTSFYWLIFTLDASTLFYIAGNVVSHDSVFVVFLIHLGAQLDLLKRRLTLCHDKIVKTYENDNTGVDDDLKIDCVRRTTLQELLVEPITELRICIEHHQQILRSVSLVQDIFNDALLLQFASSLVMITMSNFHLVGGGKLSNDELIETLTLIVCTLSQLFMYCWFGANIIAKSEDISLSAYYSKWYVADERFKTTMKILLCRGQLPIKFRAGYICELSSATFMNIVNKCYSFMAVMNRVNE